MVGYCVLDIALVVDTSTSIRAFQPPGVDDVKLIKDFLDELVDRPLEVGQYYDHVGMVAFASTARILFHLKQRTSVEELRRGFRLLPEPKGETNTPNALNLALQVCRLFSVVTCTYYSRSYFLRSVIGYFNRRTSQGGSDVVPRGTASPRGSIEAEFSLPRPRSRSRPLLSRSWPRSRLICLGLATASRHQSSRSQFFFHSVLY